MFLWHLIGPTFTSDSLSKVGLNLTWAWLLPVMVAKLHVEVLQAVGWGSIRIGDLIKATIVGVGIIKADACNLCLFIFGHNFSFLNYYQSVPSSFDGVPIPI